MKLITENKMIVALSLNMCVLMMHCYIYYNIRKAQGDDIHEKAMILYKDAIEKTKLDWNKAQ